MCNFNKRLSERINKNFIFVIFMFFFFLKIMLLKFRKRERDNEWQKRMSDIKIWREKIYFDSLITFFI